MTYWECWPAFGTKQLQATDPNGFKFEHLAGLYDKLIPSFWVFSPSDLDFFFTFYFSFRKVYILTSLSRFSHYIIHTWKKPNEFLNISIWQHCLCEAISNKTANINSDTCSPTYRLSTLLSIHDYRHRHRGCCHCHRSISTLPPSDHMWDPEAIAIQTISGKKQELLNFSKWKASISQGRATG